MKVLMIAPEPIFEPRGTPLSVVGRLKALSDMNYRVDLLTYSIGEDVSFPNLRIFRIPKIPFIKKVKIGPSLAKIPLDAMLFILTIIKLQSGHYDFVHSHEEAGVWGLMLSRIFGIPHIYDMHSSLPQQLQNFEFSNSRILISLFQSLERWVLKYSSCIITICPDLYNHVKALFPEKGSVLIENVLDYGIIFGDKDISNNIIKTLNLNGKQVAVYTGTFEPYQGLNLLIESVEMVVRSIKSIVFILVGGNPDQVAFYEKLVRQKGLEEYIIFTGQVKPQTVKSYIRCADVVFLFLII
jgi:glycosyltransferase involved in cell wall biosynthesis